MKIESSGPVRPGATAKGAKRAAASDFADNLASTESTEPAPAGIGAASAVGGIAALLALQEVPDASVGRSKALLRADQMLDRLEDLRRGLLLGVIARDKLGDLARLAREGATGVGDPKLREILGEIELRAEVELAKLDTLE